MSTDQQYVGGGGQGGGRMGYQHEQMHERRIPVRDRFVPFLAPYLMALVIVPLVELASWAVCLLAPSYLGMVIIGWCVTGFALAAFAVGYGAIVTKRVPFVFRMVAATCICWGLASATTTAYGLWTMPPWLVVHVFGSLFFASVFALMRIDSLRTAAANGTAKDFWGEVIGLRTSRPRNVRTTDTGIEIEVAHGPGETRREIQSAAAKMESALDAVAGRTTVTDTDDGRSGSSLIRFTLADPFAKGQWRAWPGPSHPGMSFAYPLRTAYYEDGTDEWFSFARSLRSPITDFTAPMDSFFGAAGTTGSGKSGGINNMTAEALTRDDVIPCLIDRAKIEQNAGWCLDMLGMAGNAESGPLLTQALRRLANYRVKVFGQKALEAVMDENAPDDDMGRKWTPELARETGEAAVLAIVDEADTAIHGRDWEWLSARGRSLGIFLYAATPRASAAEVPAVVRGSIAAWKTYAIGDNYSDGFTLANETADAGADPKKLREPGMHYLDRAPGVDMRHRAMLAREYFATGKQLRAWVLRYRGVTFQPMGFSRGAIEAMGDAYRKCDPARLMPGWQPPADEAEDERVVADPGVPADPQAPTNETPADRQGSAGTASTEEEDPVDVHPNGSDEDAGTTAVIDPASYYDGDDLRRFRTIDEEEPIVARTGQDITFAHAKPVWSVDDTEQELDRVIVTFKRASKLSFSNYDVLISMRCYFDPATCSRRLDALTTGKRTAPGGLTVERLGRGSFEIRGDLDMSYGPRTTDTTDTDNEE